MRKQLVTISLAGVLALGTVGCGAQQQAASSSSASSSSAPATEQTTAAVTWTDVATAADAAAGAGIPQFSAFGTVSFNDMEYKDPKFSHAGGVAQAVYEAGATALILREGGSGRTAPLTDRDETAFANKWTKAYEGVDVTLYGATNGAATVITWSDGGYDFGVTYQGTGGEEVTMDDEDVTAIIGAVKGVNAGGQAASSSSSSSANSTSSTSSQTQNASSTSSSQSSATQTGDAIQNIDGFDVKYTADQCAMIATEYAGAGGQAKGEAVGLETSGPLTGGGTVYYKVAFNLGEVYYEVTVDAVDGKVINGVQTLNGVQEVLDDNGNPVEGSAVEVD